MDDIIFNDDIKKELAGIKRYNQFNPMFYRTNVLGHTERVSRLVREIFPIIQKVYGTIVDYDRMVAKALVHDDTEIYIGDIPSPIKNAMDKDELRKKDLDAIDDLVKRFGTTFTGFDYRKLLLSETNCNDLECKLVKLCDMFDGMCESLHEVYAGNAEFRH